MLIINADDWGMNPQATDMIAECYDQKSISAVSAMVYMNDSERAAEIALEREMDVGLHINFTLTYSGKNNSGPVFEYHQESSQLYFPMSFLHHRYSNWAIGR